ncbi:MULTISPECIES: hypothetical protein [unclassified Bradyrhizobium]|uniref:hypothetical protein n=1 Tax=unclassified Bradyrhizobium TaxID=2631580 RepID=UPI001FFC10D8|nr:MULTISPECIES: hypothetical protein [unclassified Bradyrhizobium]
MVRHRILAAIALAFATLFVSSTAEARHLRHHAAHVQLAHPDCNIFWPCEGVVSSPRGEMIARKVGIGAAQKVYRQRAQSEGTTIVSHPSGCPSRAFCGCGAAVRIFGRPLRELWLAANWFKFPRAPAGAGMVAVRRHHVFVLEQHIGGSTWQVYDANSGGHATRVHARSITGYTIVNPRA